MSTAVHVQVSGCAVKPESDKTVGRNLTMSCIRKWHDYKYLACIYSKGVDGEAV